MEGEYIEEEDGFEEEEKNDDEERNDDEDEESNNDKYLIPREDPCTDDAVSLLDSLTTNDDCETNPNLAVIIDFLEKFGEHLGIKRIGMRQLEHCLTENGKQVHPDLIQVFTSLLKRVKLSKKILITKRSWEKGLLLFCKKSKLLKSEFDELECQGFGQLDLR